MEAYVWNLTHELVKLDVQTEIICEETFGEFDPRIVIHKIPKSKPKPRWKSMQCFRELVTQYVSDVFQDRPILIHSHERSSCHQVTTFHGPPIAATESIFSRLIPSRRVAAWRNMEKDELLSKSTKQVLFVSSIARRQLLEVYPELRDQNLDIAYPGVHPYPPKIWPMLDERDSLRRAVFVGKEWKRKGLELAVDIIDALSGSITLDVYGPGKAELPGRIINHPSVTVMGWREKIPWEKYEVLIHPAKKEPFGMVVAEARANGIKVLTSSEVGSAELGFRNLKVLDLSSSTVEWSRALEALLAAENDRLPEYLWTWAELARLHKDKIYPATYLRLLDNS